MVQKSLVTFAMVAALTFVAAGTAEAQGGRGGGFGRGGGGIMSLATREPVQKELGLSTDVAEKVKKISDAYGEEMRAEMTKIGGADGAGFRNMSDEDRKKMDDARMALRTKFLPQLKDALTGDQYTRLQQINWQSLGTMAFSDPDLIKAIGLSKEQQDKIAAVNKEFGEKTRELFTGGGGGGDRQAAFAKMQEINKERDAKANEVLTKEQQEKLTTLKGKEFDVASLRGPPGGGRQRNNNNNN